MGTVNQLTVFNQQWQPLIGAATNHTIDASNEGLAFVVMPGTTNAITDVGFRYGARAATPPVYRVSLQSVDTTTGNPTGTVLGGGSPASQTFTPPADATWDGTWRKITLANSYTPSSREEIIAVVIEYSSGTIDGTNNSSFTRGIGNTSLPSASMPYSLTNTGGTWTKVTSAWTFAIYTATEAFGNPCTGATTNTSGSAIGRRAGMFFTLPTSMGSTFILRGIQFSADIGTASSSFKIGCWDSSNAQQAITGTLDTDQLGSVAQAYSRFFFGTPPTLSFGSKYYVGVETTTTTAAQIDCIALGSAGDRAAWPLGDTRGSATYDGSSWTEDTTKLPLMELIIEDITVPSGSGGIIIMGE